MKKKKILYIIHRSWPYLGWAEMHFWEWAKSSRDSGYDVTVFITDVWDIEYFHDKSKWRIEVLEENVDGIKIRRFRVVSLPGLVQGGALKALSLVPSRFCIYSFGYPHILLWNRRKDVTLVLIGQVMADFDNFFLKQPPWVLKRLWYWIILTKKQKRMRWMPAMFL